MTGRRALIAALLLAAACGGSRAPAATAPAPAAASAAASEAPPIRIAIPGRIGPFRFVRRQDFDDAALGTMVRYRHESDSLEADVFLYPGPDLAATCNDACARRALKEEHEGFVQQFDELRSRGYVQRIRLLSQAPLVPPAGARWTMGHELHLEVRRDGLDQHSDFWLVYLPGIRFKIRSTFTETPARVAALAAFTDEAPGAFMSQTEVTASDAAASDERPLPPTATADAIFAQLEGNWAWSSAKQGCAAGTHRLVVSPDRQQLRIIGAAAKEGEAPDTTVYTVIEAGPQVLPWAPFTVRLDMQGEDRRTDAGALVKWDLVLMSRDRYHWHRTDWPEGGITAAIRRCP